MSDEGSLRVGACLAGATCVVATPSVHLCVAVYVLQCARCVCIPCGVLEAHDSIWPYVLEREAAEQEWHAEIGQHNVPTSRE